jgi:glycosyltransferase involved in cell wall biosynthesis
MKICVLIPTYNEAKTIADIINRIRKQNLDVVIVDDGSVDDTGQIAQESGAFVMKNEQNQGKGLSLIKGFAFVLINNYDAVITMDGDGQHLPQEIPDFIRLAQDPKRCIIVGNRMSQCRNMPFLRVLTNKFMSWIISIIAKQKVPDSQCGFRLIGRQVLEKLNLNSSKFEIESEILIKASRLGFKIESVAVKSVYSGERSHVNPFIDTLRFIKFILKELYI